MASRTPMPSIATYRGVDVHDFQSQERIETIIVPEIDRVLAIHADTDTATAALLRWIVDGSRSPESRLLAGRLLLEPAAALAAQRQKVNLDRAFISAALAGLDTLESACPTNYGARFHPPAPPGVSFPERPPEHVEALRAAIAASPQN